MISITNAVRFEDRYSLPGFLADAGVGLAAWLLVVPLAFVLGGFSFFLPWLIVSAALLFAAGLLRASTVGNVWLKGIALNTLPVSWAIWSHSGLLAFVIGTAVPVLASVAGIAVRRSRLRARHAWPVRNL